MPKRNTSSAACCADPGVERPLNLLPPYSSHILFIRLRPILLTCTQSNLFGLQIAQRSAKAPKFRAEAAALASTGSSMWQRWKLVTSLLLV